MKTNYEVTIGYRSVVTIQLKAETPEEAKVKAIERFTKQRDKMFSASDIALQDDNFKPDGVIDLDATWNML